MGRSAALNIGGAASEKPVARLLGAGSGCLGSGPGGCSCDADFWRERRSEDCQSGRIGTPLAASGQDARGALISPPARTARSTGEEGCEP